MSNSNTPNREIVRLENPSLSVEYSCRACGSFYVIKAQGELKQHCNSCGDLATPVRVIRTYGHKDGTTFSSVFKCHE